MGHLAKSVELRAEKRRHAETLLASYPSLSAAEVKQLLRWFRKDASALDMGLLAQHETLSGPYRQFRAEHVDKFTLRDAVNGLIVGGGIFGVMAALVHFAR